MLVFSIQKDSEDSEAVQKFEDFFKKNDIYYDLEITSNISTFEINETDFLDLPQDLQEIVYKNKKI